MKKGFNRYLLSISLVMGLLLTIFQPSLATAGNAIKVVKDGKNIPLEVAPQVIQGSTMVPLKGIADSLGAKTSWDSKTKTANVNKGGKIIKLTVGSKLAYSNNQKVSLDVAPVIIKGRTLVPLSFISEAFGLWVSWNEATKTVFIQSEKVIKHAMGTTKLKSGPKRVVILFNGAVDISLALGVKPVGAVESYIGSPWYDYIKKDMAGVQVLGHEYQPSLEKVVSVKPDLIIGTKFRHEKIYDQLSAIAPTVMTENVFDWKENLKIISEVLNKEEKGNKLIGDWNKRVGDFKKKMGNKLNTEVSLIRFDPDHARVYNTGFPGTIIEELGLQRPKDQRTIDKILTKLTSKEQIPQMDGDVIFIFTADKKGDGQALKTQEEWTNHPLWKNLKAVKNDKVYNVDEVYWNLAGGVMAANKMLDELSGILIEKQ